ncbi:MAG: HAMP domain-containing histidine kinase [Clostridia bacterium]|nr:HAMP domain-containing histidine kinase [Clostridia bacterium]
MTKRKLLRKIIVVVFVLFFCAELMIFWGCGENVLNNMNIFWSDTTANEFLHDFYESETKNTVDLHRRMTFGHNPVYSTNAKPAFAFAMIDKDKNIIFKSESGIWWIPRYDGGGGMNYVSIEEYMTPELKEEILKYQKKANGRSTMFKELEVNFDGEKYIPVSFSLDDQRDNVRKFTFTDLPVTHSFTDKNTSLYYYLHDLDENSIDHIYYEKTAAKVKEQIENCVFDESTGGSGFSGTGEMSWQHGLGDYMFFYEVEYSYPIEVITSYIFRLFSFYLFIMFAIVTIVILFSASKLYNKQKNLEQSKRAFISAAAHELKTPLAVIQNQCECVLDGINPEKNGEYVKSVYDEALRMNSIVMQLLTFNRISDLTQVKKEKCNLSQIVREEVSKYRNFADSMGANLTEEIEDDVFTECNGELIAIAIDNYLSNAIKYATGEKNVTATLKKDSRGFIFCVYNDFDGELPAQDMWQVFTRADKARNSSDKSTGMGLPVNKKIFELHNYRYSHKKTKNGIVFSFQT